MAPAFIADSDDESEANTYSPPPAAQVEEPRSFASTTSDPVSLATSSTDPVFFQGIYNEQQIAAAREQQLRAGGGGHGSLPPTAPTGTEQTDPVSLPSQFPEGTPLAIGDRNRASASRAVKSAIMREKVVRQGNVVAADPYAFPSSAEEDHSYGGPRPGMIATGSSAAYHRAGGVGSREDENMEPPSRKRQRLNDRGNDAIDSSLPPTAPPIYSSIPPTMLPVQVDEVTDNEISQISNNDLVPTMDIRDDPSLIINPRGLTSSQKQQYIAVEQAASSNPDQQRMKQDLSDQLPQQSIAKPQHQKTPSAKSTPSKSKATKRSAKSRPGQGLMESTQLGTPEQTQENQHTAVLEDSQDEGYGEIDTQAIKSPKPEHDIHEIQPTPVQATKKKRGRPKKADKQTPGAAGTQLEPAEAAKPCKVARKRGRPKKSEAMVVEQQEEVVPVIVDDAPTKVIEEDETKIETDTASDGKVEDPIAANNVKTDDGKPPEVSSVASKVTPQKPAGKLTATPQKGSADKPLYRIGLSKRSRIAPLLKSLPK